MTTINKNYTDNIPTSIVEWAHLSVDPKISKTAKLNYLNNIKTVRDFCNMVLNEPASTTPQYRYNRKQG